MSKEAMKLALEALEDIGDEWGFTSKRTLPNRKKAIAALREALAEQPAQSDEQGRQIDQLIQERDHRDEIIDKLCDAVLGPDRYEWSSQYFFEDAVREVEERMAEQPAQQQQDDAWKAEQKTLADEAVKCATEALANPNHPATMAAREYYGAAQQEQESLEDLHNALQRIDTAAVGLPTFEVRHEGGLDAVTQNIVDAITALHTQPAQQEPVAWAKEYAAINAFYGSQNARRSQLPLMRHIDDGLHILTLIGASPLAKAAFCLHPIVQNSEALDVSWSSAYQLACEYRDKANAYLCRLDTDWVTTPKDVQCIVGDMSKDCRAMLIADKRQNYGDFIASHFGKHARSEQLDRYFRLWLSYLEGTPPPASKPWVPLTEFDIDHIPYSCSHADSRLIAFAIEAKLREKNAPNGTTGETK